MSIHALFSTPVGAYKLGRKFTKNEIDTINLSLKNLRNNFGNKYSKDTQILNNPKLSGIHSFCTESIHKFQNEIYGETKTKLKITQSWANISKTGDFHHKHCHPNSYISGVLYIETSENDKINFFNSSSRKSFYEEHPTIFNQFNSSVWWLPADIGTLYLFHSNLEHEVPPVSSKKRISLSFNTFFDSDFGNEISLTYLPFGGK